MFGCIPVDSSWALRIPRPISRTLHRDRTRHVYVAFLSPTGFTIHDCCRYRGHFVLGPFVGGVEVLPRIHRKLESVMKYITRLSTHHMPAGMSVAGITGILFESPAVLEYLTMTQWEDGTPRTASSMLFFAEEGVIKVCLSDRDQGLTLWRSGASLEDCIAACELAIAGGTADWRVAKQHKKNLKIVR
jgi:hypothetical protein